MATIADTSYWADGSPQTPSIAIPSPDGDESIGDNVEEVNPEFLFTISAVPGASPGTELFDDDRVADVRKAIVPLLSIYETAREFEIAMTTNPTMIHVRYDWIAPNWRVWNRSTKKYGLVTSATLDVGYLGYGKNAVRLTIVWNKSRAPRRF